MIFAVIFVVIAFVVVVVCIFGIVAVLHDIIDRIP